MIEDATNQISGFMEFFPCIKLFGIINKNEFIIHYSLENELHKKEFSCSSNLIGWCEENL